MSVSQLENALRAGYSDKSKIDELGLFGIGFNVACANLGKKANVITKRASDKNWTSVTIDIIELHEPEDIVPAYELALNRTDGKSTILVEFGDYSKEK